MSQDHYESQNHLAKTGVPFTALQDSFYSELAVEMFDQDGILKAPAGQGKVSWVGRQEVAEAVANLLLADAPPLGIFPTTGPKAYTMAEMAAILSSITGKRYRYEEESVAEARVSRQRSAPEPWVADVWVGSYQAIAAGEVETVTSDLGNFLGREPEDLESYLTRHAELLAPENPHSA